MGTKIRVGLASGVLALTSVLASVGPSLADDDPVDSVDDGVTATSCNSSASEFTEGACDAADDLPLPSEIMPGLSADALLRFAGNYIDRSGSQPVQVFQFAGLLPADQALLNTLTGNNPRVQARAATLPLSVLNSTQDLLTNTLKAIAGDFSVGVDIAANRLDVTVGNLLQKTAATTALVGTGLLGFADIAVQAHQFADTVNRDSFPPHVGGLRLKLYGSNYLNTCTSGFSVKSNATGTHMGLTAGHCSKGPHAEDVYIGGTRLSDAGQNSYAGTNESTSDAMRYTVPTASGVTTWSPKVYVAGDTYTYRWVTSRYVVSDLQKDTKLCFQGESSGNNNCGYIYDMNRDISIGGHITHHMYGITYPCAAGDSGGSVYHVNGDGTAKAAGLVKAARLDQNNNMYFTPIGYALSDVDVSMIYH